MLKRLIVTNFAIIENIDISFKDGLTVLTGETGAGKSLIIDSLSLLLGERAQIELIRTGFDKASITGYFTIDNFHLTALLDELGIKLIDKELKVQRIISTSKSIIKVNDVTITLNDLKRISKYLADIHMQFDMQKILNPENYLEIIDGFKFDLTKEYLNKYLQALENYRLRRSAYNDVLRKAKEIAEKKDFYQFALEEIKGYNLVENEENEIKEKINYLKNYDVIYALLEETNNLIESNSLENIYEIKKRVAKLATYQNEYQDNSNKLENYYYELESIFQDLSHSFQSINYNPSELDELESRLYSLDSLKKKYAKSIPELIEYQNELESMLLIDSDHDSIIGDKEKEMINAYNETYKCGLELSTLRKEIGKSIEKELEKNMADLSLKAHFQVQFDKIIKEEDHAGTIFKDNGLDNVEFLIETNIGEGLKSLSKTVSGGEASRIMLAIKALFIKSQKISTVIFDEIDTGISGEIASKVARKIYEISLSTQVISITHLPQVAAFSKNQLKISKEVKDNRTFTKVKELDLNEKIYEIALMISGGKVTNSQLEYAKELVMQSN